MKKVISISFIFLLLLGACGKKDKTSIARLDTAGQKIAELTRTFDSGKKSETDTRLYISQIKNVIDALARDESKADSIKAIPVTVTKMSRESVNQEVQYLGDIQASYSVKVYSKVPDRIRSYYVEVGDYVKAQQPIAQIVNDLQTQGLNQAEAALKSARSQYKNIESEFQRIENLYKEKAVSQSQYDQVHTQKQIMKNALDQATAGYNTAKKQYDDALVKAPISGYITERNFEVGDVAPVQMQLVTISKVGTMKIVVNVIEKDITQLKKGGMAIVEASSIEGKTFHGRITRISPVISPLTRTGGVEVEIDNPDGLLKPGMYARVRLVLESVRNAYVLPKDMVTVQTYQVRDGETLRDNQIKKRYSVFVIENNLSFQRVVKPGIITRDKIQIIDGLKPQDLVIDLGRNMVRDSSLVSIIE